MPTYVVFNGPPPAPAEGAVEQVSSVVVASADNAADAVELAAAWIDPGEVSALPVEAVESFTVAIVADVQAA